MFPYDDGRIAIAFRRGGARRRVRVRGCSNGGRSGIFGERRFPEPTTVDLVYLFSNNSSTPVTADQARQILAAEAGSVRPVQATSHTSLDSAKPNSPS